LETNVLYWFFHDVQTNIVSQSTTIMKVDCAQNGELRCKYCKVGWEVLATLKIPTTDEHLASDMTQEEMLIQAKKAHLDWSLKQGRILNANGKAVEYYTADRGYPFQETELPHFYLQQGTTQQIFVSWLPAPSSCICGAWKRPLFCGQWEHSTDNEESVYNVQTNSLFVDLPSNNNSNNNNNNNNNDNCTESLSTWTNEQLRYYARQHVFGGFSKVAIEDGRNVCTRHHCIDWNYIGIPRPRPNKWWIEMHPNNSNKNPNNIWKEWAYAKDENGQHYYLERWECLHDSHEYSDSIQQLQQQQQQQQRLALRKQDGRDGILVLVGDHFNYLQDRTLESTAYANLEEKSTLVDLVDHLLLQESGDREKAEALLSMEACHGRVSKGWKIDASIQPWREGTFLFHPGDIQVVGTSIEDCYIVWNEMRWTIYESSFRNLEELNSLFDITIA
jgi:hypothetical protein